MRAIPRISDSEFQLHREKSIERFRDSNVDAPVMYSNESDFANVRNLSDYWSLFESQDRPLPLAIHFGSQPKSPIARQTARPVGVSLWLKYDPIYSADWNQDRQIQSLCWTNWPLFTVGLVQRGYADEDILKIIGGNILRVAKTVWSSSCHAH